MAAPMSMSARCAHAHLFNYFSLGASRVKYESSHGAASHKTSDFRSFAPAVDTEGCAEGRDNGEGRTTDNLDGVSFHSNLYRLNNRTHLRGLAPWVISLPLSDQSTVAPARRNPDPSLRRSSQDCQARPHNPTVIRAHER